METVLPDQSEKTRKRAAKIQAAVLQRLAKVTQTKAADRIGVAVSTVSRMVSDDRFSDYCALLAALGLKVAGPGDMVFDKELQRATMRMAGNWIDAQLADDFDDFDDE